MTYRSTREVALPGQKASGTGVRQLVGQIGTWGTRNRRELSHSLSHHSPECPLARAEGAQKRTWRRGLVSRSLRPELACVGAVFSTLWKDRSGLLGAGETGEGGTGRLARRPQRGRRSRAQPRRRRWGGNEGDLSEAGEERRPWLLTRGWPTVGAFGLTFGDGRLRGRCLPKRAEGRGGGRGGGEQGGRQDGSDRGTDLLITRDGFALASPTQPASFRACPRSPPGMTAFWAQRP